MLAAGKIEGDIRINGHPKEQQTFARVSGYVEQFDTHTAASTVYESLLFSGTLRNGKDVDAATTKKFVDQVCHYCSLLLHTSPLFVCTLLMLLMSPNLQDCYRHKASNHVLHLHFST